MLNTSLELSLRWRGDHIQTKKYSIRNIQLLVKKLILYHWLTGNSCSFWMQGHQWKGGFCFVLCLFRYEIEKDPHTARKVFDFSEAGNWHPSIINTWSDLVSFLDARTSDQEIILIGSQSGRNGDIFKFHLRYGDVSRRRSDLVCMATGSQTDFQDWNCRKNRWFNTKYLYVVVILLTFGFAQNRWAKEGSPKSCAEGMKPRQERRQIFRISFHWKHIKSDFERLWFRMI